MDPGYYEVTAITADVGDGVSGSRYCQLGGVLKVDSPIAPYTIANEYVASRLAFTLGLPVPPGTVAQLQDGTKGYVMLKFGIKGDSLPPTNVEDFVKHRPKLAASVVVFDAWILNGDRHPGNMAYLPPSRDLVSIFDHGHALFGTETDKGKEHLEALQTEPFLGHGSVISHLKVAQDVEVACARVSEVRDAAIKEVCRPLLGLGLCSKEERDTLVDVLVARKKAMRHLVKTGAASFVGVPSGDWSVA